MQVGKPLRIPQCRAAGVLTRQPIRPGEVHAQHVAEHALVEAGDCVGCLGLCGSGSVTDQPLHNDALLGRVWAKAPAIKLPIRLCKFLFGENVSRAAVRKHKRTIAQRFLIVEELAHEVHEGGLMRMHNIVVEVAERCLVKEGVQLVNGNEHGNVLNHLELLQDSLKHRCCKQFRPTEAPGHHRIQARSSSSLIPRFVSPHIFSLRLDAIEDLRIGSVKCLHDDLRILAKINQSRMCERALPVERAVCDVAPIRQVHDKPSHSVAEVCHVGKSHALSAVTWSVNEKARHAPLRKTTQRLVDGEGGLTDLESNLPEHSLHVLHAPRPRCKQLFIVGIRHCIILAGMA
eukprot:Opistho-2@9054